MEHANSTLEKAQTVLHNSTDISPITPREFCRLMLGLAGLSHEDLINAETEVGHKKRCVALLAKATRRSKKRVRNWGPGLNFDKMPEELQYVLGLYWERQQLRMVLTQLMGLI